MPKSLRAGPTSLGCAMWATLVLGSVVHPVNTLAHAPPPASVWLAADGILVPWSEIMLISSSVMPVLTEIGQSGWPGS
jgi:hypothetical protein